MPAWAKAFDGETAIAPPLSEEVLAKVPARRGVFLLTDGDDHPILLATGANLRRRMRYRLTGAGPGGRRADLREVARTLRWKLADSHFETDWRYLELARRVFPDRYADLLGFRRGWFVHVDADARVPAFRVVREARLGAGRCLGPFPDGKAGRRFVDLLTDVFDLCRCERVLRETPRGRPCVYAQMGRCRAYCDGSASMDDYRELIRRACRCAEGERAPVRAALSGRMRALADERRYEEAAVCKGRLDSLAELGGGAYRRVAPTEAFRFVLVQRDRRARRAKTFLADRGAIAPGPALDWPLRRAGLAAVLARMARSAATARRLGRAEQERIALVAHYLFVSPDRRGLIVRCTPDLTAEALGERVAGAAERLRLRPRGAKSP